MITPSSCPMTTLLGGRCSRAGRSPGRSRDRRRSGPCRPPGSRACRARRRGAAWPARRAGNCASPSRSASAGRVRVRSQAKHCPPSSGASQVQPERLRLRQTCQISAGRVDVPPGLVDRHDRPLVAREPERRCRRRRRASSRSRAGCRRRGSGRTSRDRRSQSGSVPRHPRRRPSGIGLAGTSNARIPSRLPTSRLGGAYSEDRELPHPGPEAGTSPAAPSSPRSSSRSRTSRPATWCRTTAAESAGW